MIVAFVLVTWLIMAQSCMKFRMSDSEARAAFASQKVPVQLPVVQVGRHHLHFAQTGNDTLPTVLFVHGTPGSWDNFKAYLINSELRSQYRLIAIDRPGFGYSDFGDAMNLENQSSIITSWMDSLNNHKPWVLVGHSLGGPLVVKLAAERPGYVVALVVLAGALDPAAEKPEKWRPILFKTPLNYLLPGALRPSNEELWYLKQDLIDMKIDYMAISCPVYVLHGTNDMLVPYSNVAYAKRMFTNSKNLSVTTFQKENHFIVWTREKEITALLMKLAGDLK